MKLLNFLSICLLAALFFAGAGSCHLDEIPDCAVTAKFRVEQVDDTTFTFVNESDAGPDITYSWNFGDGTLATETSPTHKFSRPGDFFVTLTAFSGDCTADAKDTVTIADARPLAQFNTSAACFEVNCPITFTNTSLNAISWAWDFGDPASVEDRDTAKNPVWAYPRGGTYSVRLTAYSADKRDSSVATRNVVITVPTFMKTFTVGTNPGTDIEAVAGIDQGIAGDYYVAICNGKVCFFAKADAGGTVSPANAVTPGVFSTITVNNFKKVSSGYVLVGEASAGANTAGYAFRANSSFQFQNKQSLHLATEGGIDAASDVAQTDAGNFLFCGLALDRPDSNGMYLVHTTANLVESWHRYLFHAEPGAWARAILNYDSGYLVAGYKQNGPVSEACFFRLSDNLALNTNANTFWGALSFFIDDIVALQNGVYALVGNEGGGNGRIRTVNANGALIWDQPYSGFTIKQALFTTGGRLVVVGVAGGKAAWMELNPATGAPLGNAKLYLPQGYKSAVATCVAGTTDGGFILGGNGINAANATLNLLIKLDQNGEQ
ncbi:MAG: PKD domain-containing protein [Saprospirales bacterium]|nr:PKD domain-containing protein [Saprospirales bacterium]